MVLPDAELGFDPRHAIVDIDDFTGECFELVVQPVEAGIHAAKTALHTAESRIHGIVLNRVRQHPYQNGKAWDADCQIELQVRHYELIVAQPAVSSHPILEIGRFTVACRPWPRSRQRVRPAGRFTPSKTCSKSGLLLS